VDTSALIYLSKLGRLDLLEAGADTVYIPQAVMDEVQVKADKVAQDVERASQSWLTIRRVENRQAVELLLADLGLGEAEVIVLAKEIAADRVVMDDQDARRLARRVGLDLIGTMGLLLAARLRGHIPSLQQEIERLQALGFRVTPPLIEAVLKEAGETPITSA
jgi:predicted nucleic acid-binding protein